MKKLKIVLICVFVYLIGSNLPYRYTTSNTVDYIITNSNSKSKCMCAWYVMRALQLGGCYPCGIYPAYAYKDILPQLGFIEISSGDVQKGDICVLSQNSKSEFGHIAIYDGYHWISDYKQKDIFPNNCYKNESVVHYYRLTNGWHKANIWISPIAVVEYISVLINNYNRILI